MFGSFRTRTNPSWKVVVGFSLLARHIMLMANVVVVSAEVSMLTSSSVFKGVCVNSVVGHIYGFQNLKTSM